MNIIMMGTGPYAVPTMRAIHESPHDLAALFTRPDAASGSRRKLPPNPMRDLALQLGAPVYDPADIDSAEAHATIRPLEPDLLVVCDYGQILSADTLRIARHGGFNLHASLLPKYRGAAPINWAIYHGETVTGNTVIHMTPRIDAGPCVAQERIPIGGDETAEQLEPRLAESGAQLVLQSVDALERGTLSEIPQNDQQVSRAPKLKKSNGHVDWSRTAEQIRNHIRAMQPWPKTFTHWQRPGEEPLRLILEQVQVEAHEAGVAAGAVIAADGGHLLLATGDGALRIQRLQPAGKRCMSAEEFLRGYPVLAGQSFG